MTRLSATATIAAILLAVAQGFGATSPTKSTHKSSPKVATKSTAKTYHVTAQNQFHINSTKHLSKALAARLQSREEKRQQRRPHLAHGSAATLAAIARTASAHTPAPQRATRAMHARRQAANPPPSGTLGFVSATQIPDGGESYGQVQTGVLGGLTAFITVVNTATGCAYSEVAANGDGTFTAPAATLTPTAYGTCNPAFIVGDLDGDGNTDIVEADSGSTTVTVLISNTDGTFTAGTPLPVAGASGFTGGALVPNATSGFLDAWIVDDSAPSNLIVVPGSNTAPYFGTPAAPVALIAPTAPNALEGVGRNVIIEDLDGDGIPDVAENDGFNNQLAVYLSTATPAAYTGVELATPDSFFEACSSTAGSLSGATGLPAIVETNCDYDSITVYNNSAGVFSEGVYYPVAVATSSTPYLYPEAATIANVDGTGNGDVVVVNDDSSDVTVLLGNGSGVLTPPSVGYATGGYPYNAAIVEDLNGDGLLDILVADDNQSLVWMAGFGDGTFQAARDYYESVPENTYAYGNSTATGDFNGDGNTDLVITNGGGSSVGFTVFLSNPDGSLQPGVNYGSSGEFYYAAVADFNGDGNLDIAASNYEGYVQIFTGTGTGNFIEGPFYSFGTELEGIVAGAFNTPAPAGTGVAGFNDLAVTSYNSNVYVLVNDGSGGFMPAVAYGLTAGGEQLATAQLTAGGAAPSGFADLAVAEDNGNQVGVLLGNGDGTFTAAADAALGTTPYGIAVADVSGDGIPDIVATDDFENILVATGMGDGTFPNTLITMPSSVIVEGTAPFYDPDPWGVQITDVNGDGFPDLVYTNSNYSTVGVMFGTGAGTATAPTFYDPVEFPTAGYAFGLSVANQNGDGTPGAQVAADDFAGAGILINANGTGAAPNYSVASNPTFLNIADGGTGTATITLTPVNFYSGTVTFSCGGLPLDVTCAFAPATLTPVGNAPLTTTLTVTTAAPHGALRMPADANPHQGRTSLLACLTGMGLFGLLLSGDWKNKRNRRVGILLGILVLGMMFSLVGCSSSTTPGTPIGAQTIQVTGTGSDGTTNSVNLTINVF